MAALIGGFALSSLQPPQMNPLDRYIYFLAYASVHVCTCSALTSAFIYQKINVMEDAEFEEWIQPKIVQALLKAPMLKFIMGCMAYMASVILTSWRDLNAFSALQSLAFTLGIMSVSSVWAVYFVLHCRKSPKVVPRGGKAGYPSGPSSVVVIAAKKN